MTRPVLVFGSGGQLGRTILQRSNEAAPLVGLTREQVDICDGAAVTAAVDSYEPSALVNCAAYTAVDRAEAQPEIAFAVNAAGARNVARASADARIPLVHISTDYVFGGTADKPYTEDDPVNPLSVYGKSKYAGELAIKDSTSQHLIIRTSWLYSALGNNFFLSMLRMARQNNHMQVVDDQTGTPTYAAELALALIAILRNINEMDFAEWGTYHFAGLNVVTWHDFARAIFSEAASFHIPSPIIERVPSTAYPRPAPRPSYSALDSSKFRRLFDVSSRPLHEGIRCCLQEMDLR